MLNGIPEVDLGINTKLSNIERTEAAKRVMAKGFENGKISKIFRKRLKGVVVFSNVVFCQ